MTIQLTQRELEALAIEFRVAKASDLIQKIRAVVPPEVNHNITFVYKHNPFVFKMTVEEEAVRALIPVLSPSSAPMGRLKKQLKKHSLSNLSKQLGLALALNDLKKAISNCFKSA